MSKLIISSFYSLAKYIPYIHHVYKSFHKLSMFNFNIFNDNIILFEGNKHFIEYNHANKVVYNLFLLFNLT